MQLSDDFPAWIYVLALVVIPAALWMQKAGIDFAIRLTQKDATARRLGLGIIGVFR